ncbi:MAG: ATP-binding cassette domain-containing protein [Flavobacteriaceae bacterium]|nr:ATP-binding cassette domain-containing protein [Flavobacteriaceae bacterium]
MTEKKTVVAANGVSIFQGNNLIMDEVSFSILHGEFAYLIGKTGSGKSSLLKTMYAALALREGEMKVADVAIRGITKDQVPGLRRRLGIIFQDFQLLTDRNVFDNLQFVLKATGWKDNDQIRGRIKEVLELVGLATKDYKWPHELSGGEQQRVVIARALLNHPEVVLADEPTGNLDPDLTDEIMGLLHSIAEKGTTILMATHDYRLLNQFKATIYLCENGKMRQVDSVAMPGNG